MIGPVPLAKLRPSDVEKLILALRSAKLADSTIRSQSTPCCAWAWTVPSVMGYWHATRPPQCNDRVSHARKRHTWTRNGSRSFWRPLNAPGITRRCC